MVFTGAIAFDCAFSWRIRWYWSSQLRTVRNPPTFCLSILGVAERIEPLWSPSLRRSRVVAELVVSTRSSEALESQAHLLVLALHRRVEVVQVTVPRGSTTDERSLQMLRLVKIERLRHPLSGGHFALERWQPVTAGSLIGAGDRLACFIPARATPDLRTFHPCAFARLLTVCVTTAANGAFAFAVGVSPINTYGDTNGHTITEFCLRRERARSPRRRQSRDARCYPDASSNGVGKDNGVQPLVEC